MIRVDLVDPSAYTAPYDHALATALARAGARVRLITSRFAYGAVPPADGYVRRELFYRWARGAAGSKLRAGLKLAEHAPDMARYRRVAEAADIVHFEWVAVPALDRHLLPRRPIVVTAHDLLPREPRPGQLGAQRRLFGAVQAIVVHSEYGRRALIDELAVDPGKVHVIPHGAFAHLADPGIVGRLPPELASRPMPATGEVPVVLCFGLIRPYKGIETLLAAWQGIAGAELWIVGRPMIDVDPLIAAAPPGVRFVSRFVSDDEEAALFRRAAIVVLPYARTARFDFSGVLATALAFGKAVIVTDIGGFGEVAATGAARLVAPGDPAALHTALRELLSDRSERERLGVAARAAAASTYSWAEAARRTLELYATIRPQ